MNDTQQKTFEDLGLKFTDGTDCVTCMDMSCHNNVPSSINGREYSVHISMNSSKTDFRIHATENSSTTSPTDIEANFHNEEEAVAFICKNFQWFRCA